LSQKRYIIIGDGAAGTTTAQSLRAADKGATIAILSDDPHAAYFRAALTNYLLGELREEQIWAVPPSFYDEYAIHRALVRVAQVDTKRGLLWLAQGGRPIGYDSLVLAGSRARPPTFEGAWLPGIMTMRTLQDVHRVMDLIKLKGLKTAMVVGGGPLALEWAHGLSHRGVNVMMVVREQKFLPGAIDGVASDLLLARLRHAGVQVRMGDEIMAATPGPSGRVGGVVLKSGERVACELVCVAIGVICNSEFLGAESGINLAKNGGIEVDDQMRTSVPNVYAAGDVAAYQGKLLQLWEPARMQARIVASTIMGKSDKWTPGVHYMATRLYDLDCASIGDVAVTPQGAEELVDFPQRTGRISYRKLCVKDNRLVGALMFGEKEAKVRRWGRGLKRLIDTKADISKIKHELLDPAFDLAGWLHTNELTEKPKVAKPATMASAIVGQMKGTHAINLADMPPLPAIGIVRKSAASNDETVASEGGPGPATAEAAGNVAANLIGGDRGTVGGAFADAAPPPQIMLEGPPGRIQVQPPSAIVGRDPASAIPLHDPLVSWRHAEFTIAGQFVYLRDLGSGSGTWINNAPVTTPKSLRDGDKIRIGSTELVIRVAQFNADGSRMSIDAASLQNSAQGEAKPHLEVRNGRALGLSFELVLDMITIGRDPASNIRLDDESIDWRHAWIRKNGAEWDIADAESHGVTKKNGHVLAPNQWVPMHPGDTIEIGEVAMLYEVRPSAVLPGLLAPASVAYGPRDQPAHHPSAPPAAVGYAAPHYGAPQYGAPPQHYGTPPPHTPQHGIASAYGAPPQHSGSQPPQTPRGPSGIPQSNPGRARISVRQGPGQGAVAELADVTVIGNHPQHSTLVLADPRLGSRHVEIVKHADGFYARDLGSQTGTSCRGQRLGPQPFKLHHGDVLVLGQNVALLFEASL
jgi:NADPH-dependent 2,4-dienoyl-CoA reductase/sulfur reductase-like enzyme/pSer/pThr/pTyr-binding forkhead associated (FHA) protein